MNVNGPMTSGPCSQCNEKNSWQNWKFDPKRFKLKTDDLMELLCHLAHVDMEIQELPDAIDFYKCSFVNHEEVEEIKKRCDEATEGPWHVDDHAHFIYLQEKQLGMTPLFEVRGWGYFTGVAALDLLPEEGVARQMANGQFVAHARTDLPTMIKAWEAERIHKEDVEIELNKVKRQLEVVTDRYSVVEKARRAWEDDAADSNKNRQLAEMSRNLISQKYDELKKEHDTLKAKNDMMQKHIQTGSRYNTCSLCVHVDECNKVGKKCDTLWIGNQYAHWILNDSLIEEKIK